MKSIKIIAVLVFGILFGTSILIAQNGNGNGTGNGDGFGNMNQIENLTEENRNQGLTWLDVGKTAGLDNRQALEIRSVFAGLS